METIRLIPSTYYRSNNSYVSVTDASNMYHNTDNSTYATVQHTRNSTSSTYYCYVRGFNFDDVPANAVVSTFSIKIKASQSNLNTNASYYMSLYNGTTSIANTTVTSALSTTATKFTFPNGSLTWDTLKSYASNFGIRVPLRRASTGSGSYAYIYGAEINVNYTVTTVHVTGVSLNKNSTSIATGDTETLVATVAPSNATDQSVSWSSSNTSVATVDSNGVVTAVSTGSATITVTTTDGGYTATCAVTVVAPTYVDFVPTTTLVEGNEYLLVNGNTGSVYMVSNEANGAQVLKGIAATVSSNKITITTGTAAKVAFTCELEDANNTDSTLLKIGSYYLYTDSSNRLRMATWTSSMAGKHWHYKADGKNLLWFFKDNGTNLGYTDTSSTYKYYLSCTNGDYTDLYVSTTSLENTNTPPLYLFVKDTGDKKVYLKTGGTWTQCSKLYLKVSGSWVEQSPSDYTTVLPDGTNYELISL